MSENSSVLALIFDFDDTLAPDTTSKLLSECTDIVPRDFFTKDAKKLIERGYDPAFAVLKLLLDNVGPGKKFPHLSNEDLRQFGKKWLVKNYFFPGLPSFFDDIREICSHFPSIEAEFYVISGGLQALLEGSEVVHEHIKAVYGCQLEEDDASDIRYIKRCVTFTEKTRYLFEINKGLEQTRTTSNPIDVNKPVANEKRRVPFRNMIYVGDGLTDIPCFSLLREKKGLPFGVFDPTEEKSARQALQELLKPTRVISVHSPKYGKKDDLGSLLRMAVANRCTQIQIERELAERLDN